MIFCFWYLLVLFPLRTILWSKYPNSEVSEHKAEPVGLPYAEVYIKIYKTGRGWADQNGFSVLRYKKLDTLIVGI